MKKWILKAIIQKAITYMPFSFHFNYFFQRHITKSVRLSDDFFDIMLDHFAEFYEYALKHDANFKGAKALELGTGWHPIMSMCLFLVGVDEVQTADLRSLIRKDNLKTLLQKIMTYHEDGRLSKSLIGLKADRLENLKNVLGEIDQLSKEEILARCNIYQIVGDAQQLSFSNAYFDFCYSVNVLEHVNSNVIEGLSKEFYRVNKSGGIEYHAIGVYDHFCHIDQSISKFNYLKYSETKWNLIDNGIQPQNRKRISHFRKVFKAQGYSILDEILWDAEPHEIAKIEVHPDFKEEKDLDIPYGTFVLRKP